MAAISESRRKRLEQEKLRNAQTGGAFFTMKDRAKAILRLAPLGEDDDVGTRTVSYFINKHSFVCNAATHAKPGVIDRAFKALSKIDDAEAKAVADALSDNRRTQYIMKVFDRDNLDAGPMLFRAPRTVYDALFQAMIDDGEDLSDPKEGCDFRVSKTGTGMQTEYSVRILSAKPLSDDKTVRADMVKAAAELDMGICTRADEKGALEALIQTIPKDLWKQIKGEVMKGIDVEGDGDEDADAGAEDDEDEDEKPKGKKAPAKEDDEDEDEDEDEKPKSKKAAKEEADDDEDEDEDEKPAKGKKPAADEDDEDDEDDDEDDEDDEDEKPAKSKKPAAKEEDDEDDEDDEDEKPKGKKAPAKDEDDEDDEDEDEKPAPKKGKYKV